MIRPIKLAAALPIIISIALGLGRAGAASPPKSSGITVSPAFQMVSIPSGASQVPVTFTITNNQPVPQKLSFTVADFNMLNESGGLFFVGTNPTVLQKKYGLAKWVNLPRTTASIPAEQTYKLQAEVLNLSTLSAGGHYGALMISSSSSGQQAADNQVGLHPIASSLLFVTKLQGATYDLSLAGVSFKHSLFGLPKSVTLNFMNTGNTHLVPRGEVTLVGPHNRLVSKGIINQNSSIILPQISRRFQVPLRIVAQTESFGKYQLRVDFRFDGYSQFRRYQTSFWLVPFYVIAAVVGLTIVLLGLTGTLLIRRRRTARVN